MTRTRPGAVRLTVAIFVAATATGLLVVTVLQEFSLDRAAIAFTLGIAISLTAVGLRDAV